MLRAVVLGRPLPVFGGYPRSTGRSAGLLRAVRIEYRSPTPSSSPTRTASPGRSRTSAHDGDRPRRRVAARTSNVGPIAEMTVATELRELTALAPDGTSVRLGDLWAERPVVLAFVRHFG